MFNALAQTFSSIFNNLSGSKTIAAIDIDNVMHKIHDALLESDVPYQLVQAFIELIRNDIKNIKPERTMRPDEQLIKCIYDKITAFLGGTTNGFSFQIPSTTIIMGLQGAGKTATIAKLAHYCLQEAKKRKKSRTILVAS